VTAPTGIVFDERFQAHVPPPGHPERPDRLAAIEARLARDGLLARCRRVPAREAADDELLAVHTPRLLAEVGATAGRELAQLDPDTWASPGSALAARLAAGALVDLTLSVLAGDLGNGLALVRPPGHHAEADQAMGFCLFNNVGVAAAAACHAGAERILVVDWDVHHGNGTQNAFFDDPSVLYFSTHQFPFYPGTGALRESGGPAARGRTINVPWPPPRGDADHLAAFDRVLLPAARAFRPDLVLVSAGFDAARGDLLGEQLVSPNGYAAMTARLRPLAGGKLVLALEGGYTLDAISASAAACLAILLGESAPRTDFGTASPAAMRILDEVITVQRPFWPEVFEDSAGAR
jgi:acetoin utilization deacetylase AcuC-like enzyme